MQTLLQLTGLDAAECERRMQFLGFGAEDRARLHDLVPFVESIVDDIMDDFYAYILAVPETAAFLVDREMVARLKRAQGRHFVQLCSGPYDEAYFESRLRVGMAHARIQLPPHLYLGGYLIQLTSMRRLLAEKFGEDPEAGEAATAAFGKVIILDISLATEAYIYGGYVERSTADTRAYEAALAHEALETRMREEEKREELLRMVVHDIRSPVAAIIATARAALRRYRDVTEPPGKQFSLVEATGQNVLHIIDNMVSHARAPGGELPCSADTFDVAEVVSACVAQLLPFAQQTAHAMSVVSLEPAPTTRLDRVLVRRVVANLLMNACRHTPAGSSIDVECALEGAWCRIVVSDDGPGLPVAVREALAAETIQPRPAAGAYVDSGLGLPFCKMACSRMGGRLEVEATPGRGARLVVRLPA